MRLPTIRTLEEFARRVRLVMTDIAKESAGLTILVVAHIVGALMLFVEEHNDALDIRIHMVVWPILTLALVFWFLPRFKGALVAYQWALRMHGFETAEPRNLHGKAA